MVVSSAPMLYQMSLIDDVQLKEADTLAWAYYRAAEIGNRTAFNAKDVHLALFDAVHSVLSPFNIMQMVHTYGIDINEFMNGPIREKLGIIPENKPWENGFGMWFAITDFDEPVWSLIDEVLKSSDIDIVVYQGQLD